MNENEICPVCHGLFSSHTIEAHCSECVLGISSLTDGQSLRETASLNTTRCRLVYTPSPKCMKKGKMIRSPFTLQDIEEEDLAIYSSPKKLPRRKNRKNQNHCSPWSPGKFDFGSYGMRDEDIAIRIHEEEMKLCAQNTEQKTLQEARHIIFCSKCKAELDLENVMFMEHCEHSFCMNCLESHLKRIISGESVFKSITCPSVNCDSVVNMSMIKEVLSESQVHILLDVLAHRALKNDQSCVTCPNVQCQTVFQKIEEDRDSVIAKLKKDNRRVSEAEIEKEMNRFLCRSCRSEFCSSCNSIPYHENKTCEEYRLYSLEKHCRFCSDSINNRSPFFDFNNCGKPECTEKKNRSCNKVLICNHECYGIRGERFCMPCLDCTTVEEPLPSGNDFCNICFVETLREAPCLLLDCGHVFHESCVRKKLTSGWPGARITFGFMDCPICKKEIHHESLDDITKQLRQLRRTVLNLCRRRIQTDKILELEGKEDFDKLKWAYYNFAYYQCNRCKNPYYGGRSRCDMDLGDGNNNFDPKELICGGCLTRELGNSQSCFIHGTEFIEFKCRFCCNIAVWYCWGSTHFCQSCHEIQCTTRRLTKKSKDKLPRCKGPGKCPVGGNHGENGEEYALGCSLCFIE